MKRLFDCAIIEGRSRGLNAALVLGQQDEIRYDLIIIGQGMQLHRNLGFITRDAIKLKEF